MMGGTAIHDQTSFSTENLMPVTPSMSAREVFVCSHCDLMIQTEQLRERKMPERRRDHGGSTRHRRAGSAGSLSVLIIMHVPTTLPRRFVASTYSSLFQVPDRQTSLPQIIQAAV